MDGNDWMVMGWNKLVPIDSCHIRIWCPYVDLLNSILINFDFLQFFIIVLSILNILQEVRWKRQGLTADPAAEDGCTDAWSDWKYWMKMKLPYETKPDEPLKCDETSWKFLTTMTFPITQDDRNDEPLLVYAAFGTQKKLIWRLLKRLS
jgi:hypothetical protein